jgi:hypothetical protein
MRVELPPGVRIEGVVWGRRAPLWLERDNDCPPNYTLHSLAGEVAAGAEVVLVVDESASPEVVRHFKLLLTVCGMYAPLVAEAVAIDWQI